MHLLDPYLREQDCIERLVKEYFKYNSLIIAFDFDGTVNDFHREGFDFPKLIQILQEVKALNCYLYCFTAHPDEEYVKNILIERDIPFDGVNDSPIKAGMGTKKPYYNLLLDDRAGLLSAYIQLQEVIKIIKNEQIY